jgi:hypothetical protein
MRERTLETHEPSYVPSTAKPFFIPVVHNPLGAWDTWQGAMEHVTALEVTSSRR